MWPRKKFSDDVVEKEEMSNKKEHDIHVNGKLETQFESGKCHRTKKLTIRE